MTTPTVFEAIDHLAEHYGLTREQARNLIRTPLHPVTLRDQFAGQALSTAMANEELAVLTYAERAEFCYRQADAMLAARLPKETS